VKYDPFEVIDMLFGQIRGQWCRFKLALYPLKNPRLISKVSFA